MRVYYLNEEYEAGKHQIAKVWSELFDSAMPEDSPRTTINAPHSVLEFDEFHNKLLAQQLFTNRRTTLEGEPLPDKYYIDNDGYLRDNNGIVAIEPNPQKEAYKLSQLYGLTHEQLDIYIDNNVTTLATAKEYIRKLSHVVLYLVKQTKLDV